MHPFSFFKKYKNHIWKIQNTRSRNKSNESVYYFYKNSGLTQSRTILNVHNWTLLNHLKKIIKLLQILCDKSQVGQNYSRIALTSNKTSNVSTSNSLKYLQNYEKSFYLSCWNEILAYSILLNFDIWTVVSHPKKYS